jgi:dTDP-4-dehydrorhamnose reductase
MATDYRNSNPDVWGGIECTINRIRNSFRDQLLDTGHYDRSGDLETIASLGICTIRYPIIWERHQPVADKEIDWSWADRQLLIMQNLGMQPIAGLLHHGSGPKFTELLDTRFAHSLSCYARKVAERFPWLEYYTPVNEPLTTARFSGLYGYWYPHHRDDRSFARMLVNQVQAIILSMQAIRMIQPTAKLVQTEDLTKINSSGLLSYQADFENERRWLSYDLLCGLVNRHHYFWTWLRKNGIQESELDFINENACIPEIMGWNYYVTSERYLDEAISAYPPHTHGTNGIHRYADTEAVRAGTALGLNKLLQEAWDRYHLPLAVTEAHLGCTPDEQVRWFKYVWDEACLAKRNGVDLQAVTAWSLLGAYDWDSLLTRNDKIYETGVFDSREGHLQPTLTAALVKALIMNEQFEHPCLTTNGWWQLCENLELNTIE